MDFACGVLGKMQAIDLSDLVALPTAEPKLSVAPVPFHNPRPPAYHIQTEKPEHRFVLYLKAQGFTNKEVAEKTGYTPFHVGTIVRQPWFAEALLHEMTLAGRDTIAGFLKVQAELSLLTMVELRDSDKTPAATRFNCASNLIDRFLGKPVQRVEPVVVPTSSEDRRDNLLEELDALRAEEAALIKASQTGDVTCPTREERTEGDGRSVLGGAAAVSPLIAELVNLT